MQKKEKGKTGKAKIANTKKTTHPQYKAASPTWRTVKVRIKQFSPTNKTKI